MTYSLDLRVRLANYYKKSNKSIRNIASDFDVSKSSLQRWATDESLDLKEVDESIQLYNEDKVKMLQFLKRSLDQNPFQNLEMLKERIAKKFSFYCTTKTVSNYLKIIGYSKKKIVRRLYNKTLKEHMLDRKNMKKRLKKINKDDIICIDECGVNGEIYAKHGWCKLSERLIRNIPLKELPKKHSIIMAVTNMKVLKYELYKNKAVTTDIYYKFLEEMLGGIQNKYILMDNVAFHKSKRILELVTKSRNTILFIPPYSPDFNPIEEVFSKMKAYIRRYINPVTINRDIHVLIKKFVANAGSFHGYYRHAFD